MRSKKFLLLVGAVGSILGTMLGFEVSPKRIMKNNRMYNEYGEDREREKIVLLNDAIEEQERSLGIRYENRPGITFKRDFLILFRNAVGTYNPGENEILVLPGGRDSNISTIHHELGHAYTDVVSDRNDLDFFNHWGYVNAQTGIIGEGIAEYFKVNHDKEIAKRINFPLEDGYWNKIKLKAGSLDDYPLSSNSKSVLYEAGYALVKPILDINVDRGIESLLRNQPTKHDLKNLPAYQQKILKIMQGERK